MAPFSATRFLLSLRQHLFPSNSFGSSKLSGLKVAQKYPAIRKQCASHPDKSGEWLYSHLPFTQYNCRTAHRTADCAKLFYFVRIWQTFHIRNIRFIITRLRMLADARQYFFSAAHLIPPFPVPFVFLPHFIEWLFGKFRQFTPFAQSSKSLYFMKRGRPFTIGPPTRPRWTMQDAPSGTSYHRTWSSFRYSPFPVRPNPDAICKSVRPNPLSPDRHRNRTYTRTGGKIIIILLRSMSHPSWYR